MKKTYIIVTIAFCILSIFLLGCGKESSKKSDKEYYPISLPGVKRQNNKIESLNLEKFIPKPGTRIVRTMMETVDKKVRERYLYTSRSKGRTQYEYSCDFAPSRLLCAQYVDGDILYSQTGTEAAQMGSQGKEYTKHLDDEEIKFFNNKYYYTVTTPLGVFEDCVCVVHTNKYKGDTTTVVSFYAENLGEIMVASNTKKDKELKIESSIVEYEVGGNSYIRGIHWKNGKLVK